MLDRPHPSAETAPQDMMSELLVGMRLNGVSYRRLRLAEPFRVSFGGVSGKALLHFVAQGNATLRMGDEWHEVNCGDAVFLPRGDAHALLSRKDAEVHDLYKLKAAPICDRVDAVSSCPDGSCRTKDTVIFSGCMDFDLGNMHPLVVMMPQIMQLGMLSKSQPEILPILEAMERETLTERVGFAGILARLADVVAASIVRGWVENGCGSATGWVEALRDPKLGRVLLAMHRDPGRNWTVALLAAEMGASRSVFAERFLAATGTTPVGYLTDLRMRLAAEWIGRNGIAIETAAHRVGYGSQAAFSRAFKRAFGYPPGQAR